MRRRSAMPGRSAPLARGAALRRVLVVRRRRLHADPVWAAVKAVVWRRCAGRCEACGCRLDPSTWAGHHRKLRARGGRHSVCNAVALCPPCHTGAPYAVHRDVAAATFEGLIVASSADPASVPVRLYDGRWVQLATDGTYVPHLEESR